MYGGIRKTNIRQETDRSQWADVLRLTFDIAVKGRGMATTGPMYFGAAYDRPPFFTYSIYRTLQDYPPYLRPVGFVPKNLTPGIGNGGGNPQIDGWLMDGSFEMMPIWGWYTIPSWVDYASGGYSYQVLSDSVSDISDADHPSAGWFNDEAVNWVQEPLHTRWVVSNDKHCTDTMGYVGTHSAKYTFDDKLLSPILVPIQPSVNPWLIANNSVNQKFWLLSATSQTNDGFWLSPYINPSDREFKFEAKILSDNDVTINVKGTFWDENGDDLPGENYGYQEYGSQSYAFDLKAGKWESVEAFFDAPQEFNPGIEQWPGVDYSGSNYESELPFRLEIWATGTANGQSVWIDHAMLYPNILQTDAPVVTVGVAEWLRDDYGAYIGADLWVRIGDWSSLYGL